MLSGEQASIRLPTENKKTTSKLLFSGQALQGVQSPDPAFYSIFSMCIRIKILSDVYNIQETGV